ncbi:MAG: hypothetical protein H0X24_12260 [Ktedonobacterales bacterium]|nr:hypothetical protein [Ktedonobacterales bacterium]
MVPRPTGVAQDRASSTLPIPGQAAALSDLIGNRAAVDPEVFCRTDRHIVLPANDGQGNHGGHPPTAVGMLDPQDESHDANPFADEAFALQRARYLLDYGQDVVARLQSVDAHVATHLAAQLTQLDARFRAVLVRGDQAMLSLLIEHLDDALAPGELLLREVEG